MATKMTFLSWLKVKSNKNKKFKKPVSAFPLPPLLISTGSLPAVPTEPQRVSCSVQTLRRVAVVAFPSKKGTISTN